MIQHLFYFIFWYLLCQKQILVVCFNDLNGLLTMMLFPPFESSKRIHHILADSDLMIDFLGIAST